MALVLTYISSFSPGMTSSHPLICFGLCSSAGGGAGFSLSKRRHPQKMGQWLSNYINSCDLWSSCSYLERSQAQTWWRNSRNFAYFSISKHTCEGKYFTWQVYPHLKTYEKCFPLYCPCAYIISYKEVKPFSAVEIGYLCFC